ncbi:MAG: DJ-1/PfpI family protein [Acidobacteriota bacterium]
MSERWTTAILVFPDVEVLDVMGPYEVFSRTRREPGWRSRRDDARGPFAVSLVAAARDTQPVTMVGGLRVIPDYSFADVPSIDLLIVPGGRGVLPLLDDAFLIDWLQRTASTAARVASVCSGALLLAKAGLLRGRRATTHHTDLELLARIDPTIRIRGDHRWVDDGMVTSAGVAAGIDMAFYLVEALCGEAVAEETARYIEYPRLA